MVRQVGDTQLASFLQEGGKSANIHRGRRSSGESWLKPSTSPPPSGAQFIWGDQKMLFALGKSVDVEESLTCEFKEVSKGQSPVQAIGKAIERYAVAFLNETSGSVFWGIRNDRCVTGVELNARGRDELRQVAGQHIATVAPPVHSDWYSLPFHQVVRADDVRVPIEDTFVIELHVVKGDGFFLTGSGDSYIKTLGGLKKLSGAQ